MTQVLQFRPSEPIQLDSERIGALYAQLGVPSAEDVVCRALEELAVRLTQNDELYRAQDWQALRKNTRSLIAIADQIGMSMLSRIAGDVTTCIDTNDGTALASTLSRLLRIGERSLTEIWDLNDPMP